MCITFYSFSDGWGAWWFILFNGVDYLEITTKARARGIKGEKWQTIGGSPYCYIGIDLKEFFNDSNFDDDDLETILYSMIEVI